jgi:hypothetical protein
MKKFRRFMLWLGLVLIALLIVFSIYGAFLGAAKAQLFFNSIPLAVYWTVFGVIIAASIAIFPRLLKSPGLLAMHAGAFLIIAGSMWGSQAGHEVQRKYFGSEKIQSASMSIVEGYVQDKAQLRGNPPVNQSLGDIEIGDFVIKYKYDMQAIDFVAKDKVVDRKRIAIGQKLSLGVGKASITPLRLIENLGFETVDGKEQAVEKPGAGSNPAMEITFVNAEGVESTRIFADTATYSLPVLIKLNDFRIEHYPLPSSLAVYDVDNGERIWSGSLIVGTEIDLGPVYGKITPTKIFKNMVLDGDNASEKDGEGSNPAVEVLIDIPGKAQLKKYAYTEYPGYCKAGKLDIYATRSISDYISELDVYAKDGTVIKSKAIEVNKPLYYGGYHFYQSSFQDLGEGKFATILSVTSDSGLFCVFGGFFAMCVGILYHQWLRPSLKKKKQKPETQG